MKHLLVVSIGPVQEFIAAARKTADLYAGSSLLVGVARTAAGAIAQKGTLIFPANLDGDGPNKILIELDSASDPAAVAMCAKAAANDHLAELWNKHCSIYKECINQAIAQDQITNFLEVYAAWAPIDGATDYAAARIELDKFLAGRKALREFEQPLSPTGVPKSAVDPARDGVLLPSVDPGVMGRLHLKRSENPDAISLLKRLIGASTGSAPSTSLLASRSLPKPLSDSIVTDLKRHAERCELGRDYSDLLYPERLSQDELGNLFAEADSLRKRALADAGLDENRTFPAYYAILAADGDRMGRLLANLKTSDANRKFSCALSGFARQAGVIVDSHRGHLVYAGGDDVLALLPLNTAILCADRLRRVFYDTLSDHRKDEADGTLSVGVAIVHHLDVLQVSLNHVRESEMLAKKAGGRNALAVALHTRGGAPTSVCNKWPEDPANTLLAYADAFRGADSLSRGFPYELAALAREWKGSGIQALRLRAEAIRLMERKKGGAQLSLRDAISKCEDADSLISLSNSLVIARFLSSYPWPGVIV